MAVPRGLQLCNKNKNLKCLTGQYIPFDILEEIWSLSNPIDVTFWSILMLDGGQQDD